ncbi:hypothetical protein PGT21_018849 [Puccinia graminis f. sp. tritici]|uniref:Uncharacterized protein n=1 Tax=Puccinia graminis f. sp. tritici TaxID=56615 RepID=A0A5B0QUH1_PUCGR|nr:hypothetical protein PGT21_018849 [Puccinia graminis f. sp. tritici]KAA1121766.1 hypothetical protein PGTUg99_027995 [Puccinia graminis f. sp. tritici]
MQKVNYSQVASRQHRRSYVPISQVEGIATDFEPIKEALFVIYDNAAPTDDIAPSGDNDASSGAPTPSEELTASHVALSMDAALPSDNAVTA